MGRKIRIRLWMIVFVAAGFIYLPGLIELQELRSRRDELQSEIEQLRIKNASLEKEKELLTKDLNYVERVARRKMGVVRKGEIPYKVIIEEVSP